MEFFRQEYSCGLPVLTPGELSNSGIEPLSPVPPEVASGFFPTEEAGPRGKVSKHAYYKTNCGRQ